MNKVIWVAFLLVAILGSHLNAHADSSPKCIVTENAIQDIKKLQESLRERDAKLKESEKAFETKQAAFELELSKLEAAKAELKVLQGSIEQKDEEKIGRLVEAFEKMSPKGAAAILAGVDDRLAIASMSRISTAKLAKILSSMEEKRATQITEMLAALQRQGQGSRRMASQEVDSNQKGGENNVGQNK